MGCKRAQVGCVGRSPYKGAAVCGMLKEFIPRPPKVPCFLVGFIVVLCNKKPPKNIPLGALVGFWRDLQRTICFTRKAIKSCLLQHSLGEQASSSLSQLALRLVFFKVLSCPFFKPRVFDPRKRCHPSFAVIHPLELQKQTKPHCEPNQTVTGLPGSVSIGQCPHLASWSFGKPKKKTMPKPQMQLKQGACVVSGAAGGGGSPVDPEPNIGGFM